MLVVLLSADVAEGALLSPTFRFSGSEIEEDEIVDEQDEMGVDDEEEEEPEDDDMFAMPSGDTVSSLLYFLTWQSM